MSRILVIGATSAIAEATERLLAARGDALYLVARNAPQFRIAGLAVTRETWRREGTPK